MKAVKILSPFLVSIFFMSACSNNTTQSASPNANDSSANNPTTDALDYHPDQRQEVPATDSSNTIGTDTINGSASTPNTGTVKSYNDKKGSKDSSQ